jgi:hypothetical protein
MGQDVLPFIGRLPLQCHKILGRKTSKWQENLAEEDSGAP